MRRTPHAGIPGGTLLKKALYASGYYHRKLKRSSTPGVTALCFHGILASDEPAPFRELHITPETFESVCRTAVETCSPISLDDLRAARAGTSELPARPILFTFDDGYVSVLERALPVLERYGIPATVFACSAPIRSRRHFSFDAMARRFGEGAVDYARSVSYQDWTSIVASVDTPMDAQDSHRPMNVGELRRLAASPLIEIAAHTVSHPVLARATPAEQQLEIVGSRAQLADMIGEPVRSFAYPFGLPELDFEQAAMAAVSEAGFDLAYSTVAGFGDVSSDALCIPRFVMLESIGGAELAHRLTHSWRSSLGTQDGPGQREPATPLETPMPVLTR